jgi:hypothetical protein
MLVLPNTTSKIQVVLGGTVATNQAHCSANWRDTTTAPTWDADSFAVLTNNTTDVDLVAAPAASTRRLVDTLNVYNNDTATINLTIKRDNSGTEFIYWKGDLGPGERVEYENGKGWSVFTAGGLIKTLQSQAIVTVANDLNIATLSADVINNNAVANTIQDVTGLSFPVVAGEMYWFKFEIVYTAAATTTGSRWSVSGPGSPTMLCFTSEYSLAATTTTRNANVLTYDLPAASNASSSSVGSNKAQIEGIIQPSSGGNVIARFASEIANSDITAKAGSRVLWQRTL